MIAIKPFLAIIGKDARVVMPNISGLLAKLEIVTVLGRITQRGKAVGSELKRVIYLYTFHLTKEQTNVDMFESIFLNGKNITVNLSQGSG